MYWVDGSVYKGDWRNGIQHGYGTMHFPDGTFIKGSFKNNVFLNGDQLPQKQEERKQQIEAHIYNLPHILASGHRSAIGVSDSPIHTKMTKHFVSPRIISNNMMITRRSIEPFTPQNVSFNFSNDFLRSPQPTAGQKNRNTYNGFPLNSSMGRVRKNKKLIKHISMSKTKRKNYVSNTLSQVL